MYTCLLYTSNAVFKRLGAKSDNTTTYRGMEIPPHKGVIKYKDEEITLTKNEMTIFMYLLSHREHIVSSCQISASSEGLVLAVVYLQTVEVIVASEGFVVHPVSYTHLTTAPKQC